MMLGLDVRMMLAQENGVSLGELARKERERKAAAAARPAPVIDSLSRALDCNADWNCFLAALDASKPARMAFTEMVDLGDSYGVTVTSRVVLEMDSFQEDRVVLSGRSEASTARLTDPMRARLLLSGLSRDEVTAREQQAQAAARQQDGHPVTCLFQRKGLKQFLENRKEGQFSDRDWDMAERCEGLDRPATKPLPPSPDP
jgi:nucleotide-binding universal stress UspA family protein